VTLSDKVLEQHSDTSVNGNNARAFDGVICFGGGDWWYHNRGHYDMQMMRELSRVMPVIHVNSLGVRLPRMREGKMFFQRVGRKLRSLGRGFVRIRENFGVLSPIALPGKGGLLLSRPLTSLQIRAAARKMGIRHPLVWVTCPPAVELIDRLNPVALVYQRTDRFEAFPGSDAAVLREYHRRLRSSADLTLFCARLLYEEEGGECRVAQYVDHGVDFDQFVAAAEDPSSEPDDVKAISRPRVGFIGGIDEHTFDPPLFVEVAGQLSDVQFILVGACSLPSEWCRLPNVHLLGRRPYEQVGAYMAACDVLIMPWNQSPWIRACNPVKLKEYLAVGRPIVTTDFAELSQYQGYVRSARGAEQFARQIREALAEKADTDGMRQRVRLETWDAKARAVLHRLAGQGIRFIG
jgi:glycosyltransferase involved in cell wall biosynthesis